ncbi:3-keto-5-aminohexanoate cleavage protein [Arthrobacter sp. TMN-49]
MLVKACLNGARTPKEHPALPTTPVALAADAAAAWSAGADAVHLHVKNCQGADTFAADTLKTVLEAIEAAAPGLPVGVTTGAWSLPDPDDRVAAIRRWTKLPACASVNWHEEGADAVAQVLLERGVAVEAGLWHADGVAAWAVFPVRDRCLRVLIELPDGLDDTGTLARAKELLDAVRSVNANSIPVLLHGEGSSCWPALRIASQLGLATRIGLEDTLCLLDGSPAPNNAALLAEAMSLLRSIA